MLYFIKFEVWTRVCSQFMVARPEPVRMKPWRHWPLSRPPSSPQVGTVSCSHWASPPAGTAQQKQNSCQSIQQVTGCTISCNSEALPYKTNQSLVHTTSHRITISYNNVALPYKPLSYGDIKPIWMIQINYQNIVTLAQKKQ